MEIKEKIMTTGATALSSAKGLGENIMSKGKELYVKNLFFYFLFCYIRIQKWFKT